MQQLEFIREVIARLEKIGLAYYITGSIASNYYGIPRLTHDLDLVVVLTDKDISNLVAAFEKDCYVDRADLEQARREKGMFNIIHHQTGLKIDFWLLKDDEFNQNSFRRRQRREIVTGLKTWLATAEDVILAKLRWHKITPSEKQLNDAKGVLEVQKGLLDMDCLNQGADKLDVAEILTQLINAPPPNRS